MTIAQFRPVIEMLVLSAVAFLIHWMIFMFLLPHAAAAFHFSLPEIYTFFTVCAILITVTSVLIRQVNIDVVGQAFLLTTFIKMFICFGVFYPKLNDGNAEYKFELTNFIIVFLLFLAMETFVTIRLLNKKQ